MSTGEQPDQGRAAASDRGADTAPRASSALATPDLSVKLLDTEGPEFEDLCACRGPVFEEWVRAWTRLSPSESDPYTHPAWVASFVAAYCRDAPERLRIFVVRSGAGLVGVLPFLLRDRSGPGGRRYWLESPHNSHCAGSSVALPEGCHRAVFDAIFATPVASGKRPKMLFFPKVDETNMVLQAPIARWVTDSIPRSVVHFPEGFDALHKELSRNFKNQLRKTRRNLNQLENVRFEDIEAEADLEAAYAAFVEVEASGWKGRQGVRDEEKKASGNAKKVNPKLWHYYHQAFLALPGSTPTSAHLLHADGAVIGAALCFQHGRTLVVAGIAYDEAYAQASPGQTLIAHLIENYCESRGMDLLNFCSWFEWHQRWKPQHMPTFGLRIFPSGWRNWPARWSALSLREKIRWALLRLGLIDPKKDWQPTS